MRTADYWVEKLQLLPHPEGGYFKEVYRSDEIIDRKCLPKRYDGKRSICTSIYYLLRYGQCSSFHRIKSDETWHFYDGCPLRIYIIDENGEFYHADMGRDIDKGQVLQYTVSKNHWFAAEPLVENSFTLVGCTVAPGFDFADFELADLDMLVKKYPSYKKLINKLAVNEEG